MLITETHATNGFNKDQIVALNEEVIENICSLAQGVMDRITLNKKDILFKPTNVKELNQFVETLDIIAINKMSDVYNGGQNA